MSVRTKIRTAFENAVESSKTEEERAIDIQIRNIDNEIAKLTSMLEDAENHRRKLDALRADYAKLRCGYGR